MNLVIIFLPFPLFFQHICVRNSILFNFSFPNSSLSATPQHSFLFIYLHDFWNTVILPDSVLLFRQASDTQNTKLFSSLIFHTSFLLKIDIVKGFKWIFHTWWTYSYMFFADVTFLFQVINCPVANMNGSSTEYCIVSLLTFYDIHFITNKR